MTAEQIAEIAKRARNYGLYHLTAEPCSCRQCDPTAHPKHPLHAEYRQRRADMLALLAEVERLSPYAPSPDLPDWVRIYAAEIYEAATSRDVCDGWPHQERICDKIENLLGALFPELRVKERIG